MKCDACGAAITYDDLLQCWLRAPGIDQFSHHCPFCRAHLNVTVSTLTAFTVTTSLSNQSLPPEPD